MVAPENSLSEGVAEELAPKLNIEVDIREVGSCERHFKITIPREEIDRYYEKEFDELAETAYVPGFRQGKAPRRLVEKRFRKEIGERVKSNLVLDCLSQVGDSPDITPIGEPDFDFGAVVLPDDGPMIFEYDLEVRPEFELPNWKNLKIERPVKEFDAADVDRAIEQVLSSYGSLIPSEEPAQPGDYIVTKLSFAHEGNVVSKADEETIRIRPVLSFQDGSIKDFDKLMTGVKAGDVKTAKATLSEDAPNPELRGKEVEATFEIQEIKKLDLPELNKDFLERIGGFEDVGDFRDAVLDTLKRQLEHEQRQSARQQITKALTVSASWELPPTLLERQTHRELDRKVMELRRSGYPDDFIRSQMNYLLQNNKIAVAQALKEHFILEKIAEVENIDATEKDYNTEIALIAAQSNSTPRRIRAQIEKQGNMDILRNQVVERKVLDMILENAVFIDTPFEAEGLNEEALDRAAGGNEGEIHEASEEDLRAAHREQLEKRMIDPNAK